ncbi:myosin heavy chain, clone 203-like [Anas acuta]|uniref:myosin heavy chain, clone 203-like n=1 Tax=Anas acuta TaxID=28680 RepID=UPI0035C8BB19
MSHEQRSISGKSVPSTFQLKELSQQLEMESEKRRQLEAQNCDLQEELSALRGSQEKLEKTNGQLQEEVAYLKDLLKTSKFLASALTTAGSEEAEWPALKEPRKDGNLGNPLLSIPSQKVTNTILTPYPFVLCSPQLKELSQQLEMMSEKRRQLEAQYCNLQEELSALRGSQEKLEKTNGQLQEEVAYLKDLLKTSKTRAASPDMHELSRSPPCASPSKKPTHRSRHADSEEDDGGRKTLQEHTFPDESIEAKLERYKHCCQEERKLRRLPEKKPAKSSSESRQKQAKLHPKHH